MELPEQNNVYGIFVCQDSLEKPASILRNTLPDGSVVSVKTSQFDGSQKLVLQSDSFDFLVYPSTKEQEFLFNGSVAGELQEICDFTRTLQLTLVKAGFSVKFEIYDKSNNCVCEFGA